MLLFKANSIKSPRTRKERLLRLLLNCGVFFAAGLLYATFCLLSGKSVPCLFRAVTGLKCPGCGVSSMCLCLLKLDFRGAWESNCAVMSLLPIFVYLAVRLSVRYVKDGSVRMSRAENFAVYIACAVLAAFGVLRNINFG